MSSVECKVSFQQIAPNLQGLEIFQLSKLFQDREKVYAVYKAGLIVMPKANKGNKMLKL